jgi:hypothetical protein
MNETLRLTEAAAFKLEAVLSKAYFSHQRSFWHRPCQSLPKQIPPGKKPPVRNDKILTITVDRAAALITLTLITLTLITLTLITLTLITLTLITLTLIRSTLCVASELWQAGYSLVK